MMPAIQLARLKIQISHLIEKFPKPRDFVVSLKDLYEFYSDRTRKSGRGGPISSLTPSFNVPIQVSRQLERTLQPIAFSQPEQALAIANELWRENWLECRILAFSILGWIPPDPPRMIIDQIDNWRNECSQDRVLSASLSKAVRLLWKERSEIFFDLLESWLKSSEPDLRRLGLRIIPSLVGEPEFIYLPRILNLLTPFVQQVFHVPDSDLVEIIRALAQKSPQETAYYMRRNLTLSDNPGIYALIRQSLDSFPTEVRRDLQSFLHHQRNGFGDH